MNLEYFPALNACLNSVSACLLIAGFIFIRRKNVFAHRICMGSAFIVSLLFLASYLYYHYHHGSTPFSGQGAVRFIYFFILITHTVLAALVPFLAVRTIYLAVRERFDKHVKIARWTFPLWLYVSITGVVIYWMLYRL
jgi:putative membrane protein